MLPNELSRLRSVLYFFSASMVNLGEGGEERKLIGSCIDSNDNNGSNSSKLTTPFLSSHEQTKHLNDSFKAAYVFDKL